MSRKKALNNVSNGSVRSKSWKEWVLFKTALRNESELRPGCNNAPQLFPLYCEKRRRKRGEKKKKKVLFESEKHCHRDSKAPSIRSSCERTWTQIRRGREACELLENRLLN